MNNLEENVRNEMSRKNVEDALNLFEKIIKRNEEVSIGNVEKKNVINEIDIMKLKSMLENIDDSNEFLNKI